MPEYFEDEERAFDEWIVPRKIFVIPEQPTLERGEVNEESGGGEQKTA